MRVTYTEVDVGVSSVDPRANAVLSGRVSDHGTDKGWGGYRIKFNGVVVGYTDKDGYYRTVRIVPGTYFIEFEPLLRMPNLRPPLKWWQRGFIGRFFWWAGA